MFPGGRETSKSPITLTGRRPVTTNNAWLGDPDQAVAKRDQMRIRIVLALLAPAAIVVAAGCARFSPKQTGIQHYVQGKMLADQGDVDAALAELAEAVRLNPSLAIAYAQAGDIYRRRGDHAEARTSYEKACQANPYAFKPQYNLALTYQKLAQAANAVEGTHGYLSKAVQAYLRAIVLEPEDFETNLNLSACYFQLGKYELAEQYCKAAIELNPHDAHAHSNLGIIYDSQNRLYEAIREYKASLEIDTRQPKLLVNLGSTYMRQDRFKQAVTTFEMAAELDPDDSSPWEQMGSCHYRMAGYDEAEQAFRKAVAIDSHSAKAHRGLGVVLMTKYLLNRQDASLRDDALAAWHASLEIDPDQPDLRDFVKKYAPRYVGPEL